MAVTPMTSDTFKESLDRLRVAIHETEKVLARFEGMHEAMLAVEATESIPPGEPTKVAETFKRIGIPIRMADLEAAITVESDPSNLAPLPSGRIPVRLPLPMLRIGNLPAGRFMVMGHLDMLGLSSNLSQAGFRVQLGRDQIDVSLPERSSGWNICEIYCDHVNFKEQISHNYHLVLLRILARHLSQGVL